MSTNDHISCANAGQFLIYEPETGEFLWRERGVEYFRAPQFQKIWNAKFANKPAGCWRSDGYRVIRLHDRLYLAHRLAWVLHYGEWPDQVIDHIDGNPANNTICNLRAVDRTGNNLNSAMKGNNSSGRTGVWWNGKNQCWIAEIKYRGRKIHLGCFKDFKDAVAARAKSELELGFHPNHGRPLVKRS